MIRDGSHLGSKCHLGVIPVARDPHGQVQLHERHRGHQERCGQRQTTQAGTPAQTSRFFRAVKRISPPFTLAGFWQRQALSGPGRPAATMDGLNGPESVARDAAAGVFYVSDMGAPSVVDDF